MIRKIGILGLCICSAFWGNAQITPGCTDPAATNFDAFATQNDGSCIYAPASVTPFNSRNLPTSLQESSGLIISDGQFLTHNDDTDVQLYFSPMADSLNFSAAAIPNVSNIDWEDIDQDEDYFYIGDFGNNVTGNRTNLRIFRILKSSLNGNVVVDTIQFSYSEQLEFQALPVNQTDFDCEAMIVSDSAIYLFTKEWISQSTSLYVIPKTTGTHQATLAGQLNVQGLVTGATYLKNKNLVVLCGYSTLLQPFIYLLYDFEDEDFFSGNKRKISLASPFHQVEAITTEDGLHFYLTNEYFSTLSVPARMLEVDLSDFLEHYLNPVSLANGMEVHQNVSIFPNPANDKLQVNGLNGELAQLRLTDVLGNVLVEELVLGNTVQVDLKEKGVAPGVYVLTIEDCSQISTYKIQVN